MRISAAAGLAAGGDWTDKVVIDLGCGPGNLFATLGGRPRLLIGVDVAGGSLELAAGLGYTAVLADAAHTPFRSHVADIVAINASLHHCDDMKAVLQEGARLVKPNGLLITDHDPQLTAWDYKGLTRLMWDARRGSTARRGTVFTRRTVSSCGAENPSASPARRRRDEGALRVHAGAAGLRGSRAPAQPPDRGAQGAGRRRWAGAMEVPHGQVLSGRDEGTRERAALMCVARRKTAEKLQAN